MGILKNIREQSGYTQDELAKKAGLSLRTIQRLEANNRMPKGYTLKTLSKVFTIEPAVFQEQFVAVQQNKDADLSAIKTINLSVLALFGLPFGNIILPILLWRRKRQSNLVDEVGRKIINFQILWSIVLCVLLSVAPFIDISAFSSTPLILILFLVALVINLFIVFRTALLLQKNKLDFLNFPISFI